MDVFLYNGLAVIIIASVIALFLASGLPKSEKKELSLVIFGLGLIVIATPVALFIGVMATDSPTSTKFDLWKGFLFVQAIPLLILMIGTLKWFIDRRKK